MFAPSLGIKRFNEKKCITKGEHIYIYMFTTMNSRSPVNDKKR